MGIYGRMAGLALRRPWIIPLLARTAWAFRGRDWYRRPPFVPVPPQSYLRWRMDTAYGDPDADPPPAEFLRYLEWSDEMRRRAKDRS
jgi:hypothetical protein